MLATKLQDYTMAFGEQAGLHQLIGLIVTISSSIGFYYSDWWLPITVCIAISVFGLLWFLTVGHGAIYGPFLWVYAIGDILKYIFRIKSS
jgi:hypothetical protein